MTQRGFTLIAAVFLIVAIASLATCVISLTGTQHYTTMLSVKGARAFNAARSGAEWGVYRAVVNGSCAANTPLTLNGGAFDGYAVTVQCTATAHTESPASYNVYTITSFAEHGGMVGDRGYVSRTIRVVVTDAP